VSRPVNKLTSRLVSAKVKAYQVGQDPLPPRGKILPLLTSNPKTIEHALMALIFLSGFRPSDLDRIDRLAWDQKNELLWSKASKFYPAGRHVLVPPMLAKHLGFLSASLPDTTWWTSTVSNRSSLLFSLRSFLADNPSRLPSVTLKAARRFMATFLYEIGAPSPYIMRQLGHRWWATSQMYIATNDSLPAPWQGTSSISPGFLPFVHPSAPTLVFTNPAQLQHWLAKWRASFHFVKSPSDCIEPDSGSDSDPSDPHPV